MSLLKSRSGVSAVTAVVLALGLLIVSFYKTDVEVYLFPRITAILIAILASVLLFNSLREKAGDDLLKQPLVDWKALLPGLAIGIIYILSLERLGFYFCSFIAYFLICAIYGKRGVSDLKAGVFKLAITLVFMAVLYGLFWKLLHVRTPTGIFI